jgi:hypothetical protein
MAWDGRGVTSYESCAEADDAARRDRADLADQAGLPARIRNILA